MRTIGFYDDSSGPGGTTRYLIELLGGLDRDRYKTVIFSPARTSWHDDCERLGATVVTLVERRSEPRPTHEVPLPTPVSRWHRARNLLPWYRWVYQETQRLATLFGRHPVDLLHSNNVGDEVAPIAARKAGIKRVIGTLHVDPTCDLFRERRGPAHRWLQRRCLAALDIAIAVSERSGASWRRELGLEPGRPRFENVPSGIAPHRLERRKPRNEAKAALGISSDTKVIGTAGRLDWAKGYVDLLDALPLIRASEPNAVLAHAGSGPLQQQLADQASRLGITNAVLWLGYRDDVRDLLEACDVYVQPSWCESQGLAVLEAGALALPTVVTDVGGLPASVDCGSCGWVVPPRCPPSMAAAIVEALQSPDDRGRALQHRVLTLYTSDRMVRDTVCLYESLMAA